jgi:hypothetical protein
MVELADIFRLHGPESRARFGDRMPTSHLGALQASAQCRPEALGGHVSQCAECQALESSSHACKNRHCPTCQNDEATRGLDTPRALLLPVPSVLVPFTLPEALRPVARSNQQCLDNALFQTSAAAVQGLSLDAKHLGGQIGMVDVLHTWTRDLAYHPHVHDLVPAGAWSPDGSQWLAPRSEAWRVPVRALSHLFRGKCKEKIAQANLRAHVPAHVWPQAWVTHGEPGGTGHEGITSLAPSIRRIAMTNNRMEKLEDGYVTFRCKASGSQEWQHRTFPAQACIRRVLQHVLPKGCITVRYYGFLSPTCRNVLTHLRHLLSTSACHLLPPPDEPTQPPRQPPPATPPARQCTTCRGPRVLIQHLSRPKRAPP